MSARQVLAISPVVRVPARWAMVRAYLVAPRRLEIMLIGAAIDRRGTGVPAFRLTQALIAFGTGMRFSMGRRCGPYTDTMADADSCRRGRWGRCRSGCRCCMRCAAARVCMFVFFMRRLGRACAHQNKINEQSEADF